MTNLPLNSLSKDDAANAILPDLCPPAFIWSTRYKLAVHSNGLDGLLEEPTHSLLRLSGRFMHAKSSRAAYWEQNKRRIRPIFFRFLDSRKESEYVDLVSRFGYSGLDQSGKAFYAKNVNHDAQAEDTIYPLLVTLLLQDLTKPRDPHNGGTTNDYELGYSTTGWIPTVATLRDAFTRYHEARGTKQLECKRKRPDEAKTPLQ
jgi:hypothetical protein